MALILALGLTLPWLGSGLNKRVEYVNGGRMPVWILTEGFEINPFLDPVHRPLTRASKDKILADIIPVYAYHHATIEPAEMISLGDLLISLGELLMAISNVLVPLFLVISLLKQLHRRNDTYVHEIRIYKRRA